MRRFDLATPSSVDECVKLLAERGPATKLVAGGTDLLPQMKNGLLKPARVIDLSGVAELRVLAGDDGRGLRVGAGVTARHLELDARVRAMYPSLAIMVTGLATASLTMSSVLLWMMTMPPWRRYRWNEARVSRSPVSTHWRVGK